MDNTSFHHRNLNEKGRENTDFSSTWSKLGPTSSLTTASLLSFQMIVSVLWETGYFRKAVSRVFIWLKSSNQRRNALRDPTLHAAEALELLSWNSSIQQPKNWRRISHHPAGWWFIRGFLSWPNFTRANKQRVSQCVISQCSSCTACANSGYGELSEKRPLALCIAERQRILRGTPNLTRQPKAMSREKASAGSALSSAVN